MMRRRISRLLPSAKQIHSLNLQRFFGKRIHDQRLWSVNRTSTAKAVAIGLFCAYLPFPLQMLPAALIAVLMKANLPVSVALVWISNPLTFVLVFTPPYLLGLAITGQAGVPLGDISVSVLFSQIYPLLVGCLIFGIGLGTSGYVLVQVVWRMAVTNRWTERQKNRKPPSD